jgi:sulfur relay (sulfurtransferase) DsrF/TusC family protein
MVVPAFFVIGNPHNPACIRRRFGAADPAFEDRGCNVLALAAWRFGLIAMKPSVSADDRFTFRNPCPICGGHERMPHGKGVRCYGFLGSDGRYAHCTREDYAGGLDQEHNSGTYAHRLDGPCRCGHSHAEGSLLDSPISAAATNFTTQGSTWTSGGEAPGGIVAEYRYSGPDGVVQHRITRHNPRTFRTWHRSLHGEWVPGQGDARLPLYRLPDLLTADPETLVLIVEGEKDADRLADLGLTATTNPFGAGKWRPEYTQNLRGRRVCILPDNDETGEGHATDVAQSLAGVATEVRVLRLPGLPPKGDVSDWLDASGTREELDQLVADAPAWEPERTLLSFPTSEAASRSWPTLDPAALHGLAGDVVRAIEPHTEGDPVAVLVNFLTMFGSAIGPSPFAPVGATKHQARLFAVLVGETARARKGTAHAEAERIIEIADPGWKSRVMGGLSSGEGLINAVRDASYKTSRDAHWVIDDPGVEDKRLLAVEPEFASVLRVASRDGNTLTNILRRAWDGDDLRTLTRNSPLAATNSYISMLGHITREELLRELSTTDRANGFANRFLFACVKRSKYLPHGGNLSDETVQTLASQARVALAAARACTAIRRDEAADRVWEGVYPVLTTERPGMLGAITARAEAQTLRLSLLYALIDGANSIKPVHLEAALALWEYCEESAAFIFGDAAGDTISDQVISALRANGCMSQTALSDLFGRNVSAKRLYGALQSLTHAGRIRSQQVDTGGRPRTEWEMAT